MEKGREKNLEENIVKEWLWDGRVEGEGQEQGKGEDKGKGKGEGRRKRRWEEEVGRKMNG